LCPRRDSFHGSATNPTTLKPKTKQEHKRKTLDRCRGALGLEVPPEKLCPLQKALVLAANLVGKPVAINMLVDSSEMGLGLGVGVGLGSGLG